MVVSILTNAEERRPKGDLYDGRQNIRRGDQHRFCFDHSPRTEGLRNPISFLSYRLASNVDAGNMAEFRAAVPCAQRFEFGSTPPTRQRVGPRM